MKRFSFRAFSAVALLALALTFASAPRAHAQLGVAAGINYDDFSDIDVDTDRDQGYHVGVFYDARLGPLALRPGIYYMNVGDIQAEDVDDSFSLRLIEVPVDARFRLGATPFLKPYVLAGPVLRVDASGDDFDGDAEDFSFAANAGIGAELTLPGADLRLYPELRYAFGISDFAGEVGGVSAADDDSARLNSFMLRLGIAF